MNSMGKMQPLEAALAMTPARRSIMGERKKEESMEKQQKKKGW